jgi:hypothetical protein
MDLFRTAGIDRRVGVMLDCWWIAVYADRE